MSLPTGALAVRDGWLRLTAEVSGARPIVDTYGLWDAGSPQHPTSITLRSSRSSLITSTQSAAADTVEVTQCTVLAAVDRPCLADGAMPRLDRLAATYGLAAESSGMSLIVAATGPPDPNVLEAYVLRNAVLGTDGLQALVLFASLSGSGASSGSLVFEANLTDLTPTLPDPYAAALVPDAQVSRTLLGSVRWAPDQPAVLAMELPPASAGAAAVLAAGGLGGGAVVGTLQPTAVDVAATTPGLGTRTLGVAVRAAASAARRVMERRRRSATQLTPRPVDPLTPVPLVRASSDPSTWHLADPADVLSLGQPGEPVLVRPGDGHAAAAVRASRRSLSRPGRTR